MDLSGSIGNDTHHVDGRSLNLDRQRLHFLVRRQLCSTRVVARLIEGADAAVVCQRADSVLW